MDTDTIAAIATPPGRGAVGIIRISGKNALHVIDKIFRKPKKTWQSHKMYYGYIYTGNKSYDTVVDEVMICCMLAPRSYTAEDVVEIYTHGGTTTVNSVLEAATHNGARLAQAGEFTKRAFFSGRINLSQAEAVMDLISAKTNSARQAGLRQLGGGLSRCITEARDRLLMWIANIELSIDYPEHEDEAMNKMSILEEGQSWLNQLEKLLQTADYGRIISEGIKTAIIGRPNVGKSTLLNTIIGEDRAIVHEIPGTTRDVLSVQVILGNVMLNLMDTAGIRDTSDPIESIGVKKSIKAAHEAEMILYILDRSKPPNQEDLTILEELKNKHIITILNKCDLPIADGWDNVSQKINHNISAYNRDGLDKLYKHIDESFNKGLISSDDSDIITRHRHKILLESAIDNVKCAMDEIMQGIEEDLISVRLREAYTNLGEILGLEVNDDIIDRIFSEFCVGK